MIDYYRRQGDNLVNGFNDARDGTHGFAPFFLQVGPPR